MPTKMKLLAAAAAMTMASAAGAAPIYSDTLESSATSVNTSTFPAGPTVTTPGLTISGGINYSYAVYAPDRSYLDVPGAITLAFTSPASGFGFDYEANNVPIIVTAFDAMNNVLEADSFTGTKDAKNFLSGYAGIDGLANISRVTVTSSRGNDSVFIGTVNYVTAAVPEAATWAMMMVGLGVVGGSLRRRRAVSARVSFA